MNKITHIGSLPFLSIEEALDYTFEFDLPVLPSLPQLFDDEWMIKQVMRDVDEESFILKPTQIIHHAKSLFLNRINDRVFKWQVVGPVTLLKSFARELSDIEKEQVLNWHFENILNTLNKEFQKQCYFFLDEPLLMMAESSDYQVLNTFIKKLEKKFYKLGVHCCSNFDPKKIKGLDGISFDLSLVGLEVFESIPNLELFIGALDTKNGNILDIDLAKIENSFYLTPSCGLALSSTSLAKKVPFVLKSWSK